MSEDEPKETGYTGLFAPGVATAMFLASIWHLHSDSPATWRGGAPISPATIFVGGFLLLVLPMWLSRNDNALFPIALLPGRREILRTWAVRISLILMALAIAIAAFAQNDIMEGLAR